MRGKKGTLGCLNKQHALNYIRRKVAKAFPELVGQICKISQIVEKLAEGSILRKNIARWTEEGFIAMEDTVEIKVRAQKPKVTQEAPQSQPQTA